MGMSSYTIEAEPVKSTYELPVSVSGFKFAFEKEGDNTTLKIEGQPDVKLNALQLSDLKELVKAL